MSPVAGDKLPLAGLLKQLFAEIFISSILVKVFPILQNSALSSEVFQAHVGVGEGVVAHVNHVVLP